MKQALDERLKVAQEVYALLPDLDRAVTLITDALKAGGKVMLCGNGGSAADAQHIAAELTGPFVRDRRPLSALALHGNPSSLTAIANDYGYEDVFAREVAAHGRPGGVLLAISTSGGRENILRAVRAARETLDQGDRAHEWG